MIEQQKRGMALVTKEKKIKTCNKGILVATVLWYCFCCRDDHRYQGIKKKFDVMYVAFQKSILPLGSLNCPASNHDNNNNYKIPSSFHAK